MEVLRPVASHIQGENISLHTFQSGDDDGEK